MKVKDVKGFPKKIIDKRAKSLTVFSKGFNQAREEIGNLEIDLRELIDEEKLTNIIAKTTSKTNTLEDMKIAKAIKEQANELVKD